ncbi:MAG: hypothetical protein EXR39_05965 [Betaproteobacteria bacterium]|nr:hypothetical protein [Betaproteobacteria bacterium]
MDTSWDATFVFIGSIARSIATWLIVVASFCVSKAGIAAEPAGQVLWLHGPVMIIDVNGNTRTATINDPIEEGETIRTGADGLVQIRFIDGGVVFLRTATALQLERYSFLTGSREEGAIFMRLVQGGVRSVTGLIAKTNPDSYMLETPTALLGVRDTDHETYYVPPNSIGAAVSPGIYEFVHAGATVMQGSTQAIELETGQVGYAGIAALRPEPLEGLPPIYRPPAEAVAIMASPEAKRAAHQRITAVLAHPPDHTSGVEPWERTPPRTVLPAINTQFTLPWIAPPRQHRIARPITQLAGLGPGRCAPYGCHPGSLTHPASRPLQTR